MSEENEQGQVGIPTTSAVPEKKTRKKRRASNYSLQKYAQIGTTTSAVQRVWTEVKDGFVSPKAALSFAEKEKMEGVFRVVRIATSAYAYTFTRPEPVLTIEKTELS